MSRTADDKPQDSYLASLAAPAIGGAVGAAAGYVVLGGGYDGAVVGAAAVPYIAAVAEKTGLFAVDWLRRMNEALRTAAVKLGHGPQEFAVAVSRSERTRFLTDAAMKAAADVDWPAGVRAVGQALAAGLTEADDSPISIPKMVLPAMTELTEAHVQLLDLLVMARTWNIAESGPQRIEDKPWLDHTRSEWPLGYIKAALPRLEQVLPALLGTLERHGLIVRKDPTAEALSKYSDELRRENSQPAGRSGLGIRQVRPPRAGTRLVPPAIWSPTPLGRQVLAFYELAGHAA